MIALEDEEEFAKENEMTSFNFNTGKAEIEKIKVDRDKQKKLISDMMKQDVEAQAMEEEMMRMNTDGRLKEREKELITGIKGVYKDKVVKSDAQKEKKASEETRQNPLGF